MSLTSCCPQKFYVDKTFRHILWAATLYNAVVNGCAPPCSRLPNVRRFVQRLECSEDPEGVLVREVERLLGNVLDCCDVKLQVWGLPGECAPGPLVVEGDLSCVARLIARVARVVCTFCEPSKPVSSAGEGNCAVGLMYRLQGCARKMPDPCDWLATVCFGASGSICGTLGKFGSCVNAYKPLPCDHDDPEDCKGGCRGCGWRDAEDDCPVCGRPETACACGSSAGSDDGEEEGEARRHFECGKQPHGKLNGCCEIPSTSFDIPLSIFLDSPSRCSRKFTRLIVFPDLSLFEKQTCIPVGGCSPLWEDEGYGTRHREAKAAAAAARAASAADGFGESAGEGQRGAEPDWFAEDVTDDGDEEEE